MALGWDGLHEFAGSSRLSDGHAWRPTGSLAALRARASILGSIRGFFAERGVMEVQTPTLGLTSTTEPQIDPLRTIGGAFLQTSPEHYMKRLLAAGAPSIYQLGPTYRAGEKGSLHREEFTMLEWYRLGFDDAALMDEVAALVDCILGPGDCRRISYESLVGALKGDQAELDLRFASAVERLGEGRWFVTDYPAEQAALARLRGGNKGEGGKEEEGSKGEGSGKRGKRAEARAARFELIVDGVELANGYHELTDPAELRQRMMRDNAVRSAAGRETMMADERLLAAMASGLPDCAGVALGVDRLAMLAIGASSLAEVMSFADW